MTEQTKKVALPAYLPKRLEAFKITKDGQPSYLLRDKLLNKVHDMEPWQFFLLEVLPGCENYPKLQSVFEDRFGRPISQKEIELFFASLGDRQLLDMEGSTHALLAPFRDKGYEVKDGQAVRKAHVAQVEAAASVTAAPAGGAPAVPAAAPAKPGTGPEGDLPAGMNDAVGFDPRATRWMLKLFDPRPALKLLGPVVAPLRYIVYVLPLLLVAALMLCFEYSRLIVEDMERLHSLTSLLEHVIFSMFTVNLLVTLTTAFIAHAFRATVSMIGVSVFMGFLPRFVAQVSHVEQLSRRERMWLQGGPLLVRLALFSLGVLIWYNTRDGGSLAPKIGMALFFIAGIDLLFVSGNPLVKGCGYHLLAAFANEPHLRGKAYKTLLNRLNGRSYKDADGGLLSTYALLTTLYAFVLIIVACLMVGAYLQSVMLGGTAIVLALIMGFYLIKRSIKRLEMIQAAYERSVQFDRWRKRTLPDSVGEADDELKPKSGWSRYLKVAGVLTALLVLVMPYPYESGGRFSTYPNQRQVITTDFGGVVQSVHFDGGETVKKGTLIATLATPDYQAQVSVYDAKVAEQQAVLADLKSKPKPEYVAVAQRELEVAMEHESFTKARVPRMEQMHKDGVVSYEELDAARREYQVDVTQTAEKRAALALAKTGPTKDEIAAAEAKLKSLKDERDLYASKVGRASLVMPFDGNLLTLHLKDRLNSYIDKGQSFATVEDTSNVTVEIQVPETDISYVKEGAAVRVRPVAFSDRIYEGKVTVIDRNVTNESLGTVVKVIAIVPNPEGDLRTGMTGYAKIAGLSMPVWKAFTLAVQRFVTVQVWSWIP